MRRRRIVSKKWQEYNPSIKDKCDKIAGLIANEFGEKTVKCYAGSYSFMFKSNGSTKTVAKLIPQYEYGEDAILVAFTDVADNAEAFAKKIDSFVESVEIGVYGEPFSASKMKESEDINCAASIIIEFVKSNMGWSF